MKTSKAIIIGLTILFLVLLGGLVWLSHANIMPAQQKVEQVIPDDSIPR